MLRTFAASLLAVAAMGKGNGDGFLRVNSFEKVLVDDANVTLTLYIYNARNGDIDELHGDVTVVTKPDKDIPNFMEYGFCMKSQDSQTAPDWDCQAIRPGGSLQPPADLQDVAAVRIYQGTYGLVDGYRTGTPDFATAQSTDAESNVLNDPSKNWVHVDAAPDRSNRDCVKGGAGADDTSKVRCTVINSHFLRNFATSQTTEDIQIAHADHDKVYEVQGWVKYCDDQACNTKSSSITPNPAVGDSTAKTINLVSKAYVDAQNAPAVSNTGDSGAVSTLGTFAAATAAATAALLF